MIEGLTINVEVHVLHHWYDDGIEYAVVEIIVENYSSDISLLMVDHENS